MDICRVAYIDHSYHTHTVSTQFVIDTLRMRFDVDVFWDDSWQGGDPVSPQAINDSGADAVVFFQILYEPEALAQLTCKNLVFIPMYDGSGCLPDPYFLAIRHIKILNFSSTLHRRLQKLGLRSHCVQYFPDPERVAGNPGSESTGPLRGFFWQRTGYLTWNHVRTLVKDTDFSHFHLHTAVDPPACEVVRPDEADIERYRITLSDWFDQPEEYLANVADADVFFTPRLTEGIGQSFLEAMGMGKCVVAPNYPTMNEYIRHGENGLLFDPTHPLPVDFSRARELGQAAAVSARQGYAQWLDRRQEINDFLEEPVPEVGPLPLGLRLRLLIRAILVRHPLLHRTVDRVMAPVRRWVASQR